MMMINLESGVVLESGGTARQAIGNLPAYEYTVPQGAPQTRKAPAFAGALVGSSRQSLSW
jgi:hypothetical protein